MEFLQKQSLNKVITFLSLKLAGAGFLILIMSIYLLLATKFDMYEFVEGISYGYLWMVVFGYGIFCSLLIDLIVLKVQKNKPSMKLKLYLYIFAGYAIFLINGINIFTIIAGTVGAVCSLLFYYGTFISNRFMSMKFLLSIFVPILLLLIINVDFTEKVGWEEKITESSYKATFDYFNGEHEIPIQAKINQTIIVSENFINRNGGGYGFHVLNEKDDLVPMTKISEKEYEINIKDTGIYRLVVTGDDVKGSFKITWKGVQ